MKTLLKSHKGLQSCLGGKFSYFILQCFVSIILTAELWPLFSKKYFLSQIPPLKPCFIHHSPSRRVPNIHVFPKLTISKRTTSSAEIKSPLLGNLQNKEIFYFVVLFLDLLLLRRIHFVFRCGKASWCQKCSLVKGN